MRVTFQIFGLSLCVALCFVLTSCERKSAAFTESNTIGSLAYSQKTDTVHRVYLAENDHLVPFLVLQHNDNGSTLLLREFLLPQLLPYSISNTDHSTYYANSYVDDYLNNAYLLSLPEYIRDLILTTQIEIASLEGIKTRKKIPETISRKIFLLSADEVGASFGSLHCTEGKSLAFFRGLDRMKAYDENGLPQTWYLRTAVVTQDNAFISISFDGSAGMGSTHSIAGLSECGVRPAFCLPSSTKVRELNYPDDQDKVYVIDLD